MKLFVQLICSAGTERSSAGSNVRSQNSTRYTSALLHLLPVCFWVQSKVLVLTFKALWGMEAGYLRARLQAYISPLH